MATETLDDIITRMGDMLSNTFGPHGTPFVLLVAHPGAQSCLSNVPPQLVKEMLQDQVDHMDDMATTENGMPQ